jgi:hypothetical protein
MRKQLFFAVALVAAGAALPSSAVFAQNPANDYSFGVRSAAAKADDDAYYFYSGEMYTNHAYDQADVLTQYAARGQVVPISVIEEHATEIRNNLTAADRSYGKLSKQWQSDAEAEKHLKREHEHRQAAIVAIDKLQADAKKAGKGEAKAVAADAKTVQTELSAASGEHRRFLQKIQNASIATKQ